MGKGNVAEVFLLGYNEKIGSVLCKFSSGLVKKVTSTLIKFTEPKKVRTQEVRCKKIQMDWERWEEMDRLLQYDIQLGNMQANTVGKTSQRQIAGLKKKLIKCQVWKTIQTKARKLQSYVSHSNCKLTPLHICSISHYCRWC